jgi:hypothetical protein
MVRFDHIVFSAALVLASLPACGRSNSGDQPVPANTKTAAKPDTAPVPVAAAPASSSPPVARHKAYGAFIFMTEEGDLRTSACLSIDEVPPQAGFGGIEPVFSALLKAFKAKDETAYDAITVPEQSSKGKKCPSTMKEFFAQFEGVTPQRIDHVYEFEDLTLVDAVLRMPDRDVTFAFAFERSTDGKLLYAPCAERTPFYAAVRTWLSDPRAGDEFSPRCSPEVVEHATHRVPFSSDPARAGALLLRGAPIDDPGDLRATAAKVTVAVKAIERAAAARDVRALQKQMAEKGGEDMVKSLSQASPKDRAAYADALTGLEPFFVFDASPLVIAYVRQKGAIRTMYFIPGSGGRLIWTNGTLFTETDGLFKRGPLDQSASLPKPFSTYRIN